MFLGGDLFQNNVLFTMTLILSDLKVINTKNKNNVFKFKSSKSVAVKSVYACRNLK